MNNNKKKPHATTQATNIKKLRAHVRHDCTLSGLKVFSIYLLNKIK